MTARVLLLNASFEPLGVLTVQKAVRLILRGSVEPASETLAARLHSPSAEWAVPTVIRLQRYVNAPRRRAQWSKRGVLQRDNFTCIYCGVHPGDYHGGRMLSRNDFTIDHVMPRSRSGGNTWGNTACACRTCNHRKGDRTPHEAGMTMRWEPKIPRVDYIVISGDIPESWKIYLTAGVATRRE